MHKQQLVLILVRACHMYEHADSHTSSAPACALVAQPAQEVFPVHTTSPGIMSRHRQG